MMLQIEDDLSSLLESPEQSPEQATRELLVTELFRRGRISGGRAAELLHLSREGFIKYAASVGIPYIDWDSDDLEREFAEVAALDSEHGC